MLIVVGLDEDCPTEEGIELHVLTHYYLPGVMEACEERYDVWALFDVDEGELARSSIGAAGRSIGSVQGTLTPKEQEDPESENRLRRGSRLWGQTGRGPAEETRPEEEAEGEPEERRPHSEGRADDDSRENPDTGGDRESGK